MIKFKNFKNFKEKALSIVDDEKFKKILDEIFNKVLTNIFDENVKILTKKELDNSVQSNKKRQVLVVNEISIDINGNSVLYKIEDSSFIRIGKYYTENGNKITSFIDENQVANELWIKKNLKIIHIPKKGINIEEKYYLKEKYIYKEISIEEYNKLLGKNDIYNSFVKRIEKLKK